MASSNLDKLTPAIFLAIKKGSSNKEILLHQQFHCKFCRIIMYRLNSYFHDTNACINLQKKSNFT